MRNYHKHVDIIKEVLKPIAVPLLLGIIYVVFFQKFGIGIPCVFRKLTGYLCPGCGMTHALAAAFRLDFRAAWEYNALSITVFPLVCVYMVYRLAREKMHKGSGFAAWEYILLAVVFLLVVCYGVFRNIS